MYQRERDGGGGVSVWAPRAKRVELVTDDARVRLEPAGRGYFATREPHLAAGTSYGFSLDGGEPRPDPRSRAQPSGPHGRSRAVMVEPYPRRAPFVAPPLGAGALYELHLGTFTEEGTFDAAIARLDHLVELGVSHVEVMPVAAFVGERGWGYDGVNLYAVHRAYGGVEAFVRFVDACHARGLAVILDVVYNHFGPDGNYVGEFGPYFTDTYHTPWGDAVNLDGAGSDEVRRFFIDNALYWMGVVGVDGLRLDAVHALIDRSPVPFLVDLAEEVRALGRRTGRHLVLIAENDRNDPRLLRSLDADGLGMDAQWSDDLHHALYAWLSGERRGYFEDFGAVEQVAEALRHGYAFRGAHSEYRDHRHGAEPRGVLGPQHVVCIENHDQVANGSGGRRFHDVAGLGSAKIAATLTILSPFTPMLFQGEEWAASTPFHYFTDHQDPALAEAVRKGRLEELSRFAFEGGVLADPQDAATFRACKLRWDELEEEPHRAMLAYYKHLLALRRARPELADPRLERVAVEYDDAERWLTVTRDDVQIVVNAADEPRTFPHAGRTLVLLASETAVEVDATSVRLPKTSCVVLARS